MNKNIVTSFGLGLALSLSLTIGGCASNDGTPASDPAPSASPEVATPAAPQKSAAIDKRGPVEALPASGAEARGAVLGTVLASASTSKDTGITVWGTFKKDGKVTTYGFDKDGTVVTQLSVQHAEGSKDLVLSAPGAGLLRLSADGKVLESSLVLANQRAIDAMSADFQATGEDAAYGWFTWVRTGVFCAIAGGCAGANVAADFACAEGAIELLTE